MKEITIKDVWDCPLRGCEPFIYGTGTVGVNETCGVKHYLYREYKDKDCENGTGNCPLNLNKEIKITLDI